MEQLCCRIVADVRGPASEAEPKMGNEREIEGEKDERKSQGRRQVGFGRGTQRDS